MERKEVPRHKRPQSRWEVLPEGLRQSLFGRLWPSPEDCGLVDPEQQDRLCGNSTTSAAADSRDVARATPDSLPLRPPPAAFEAAASARLVCRAWAREASAAASWLLPDGRAPDPPATCPLSFSGLRWLLLENVALENDGQIEGPGGANHATTAVNKGVLASLPRTLQRLSLIGCRDVTASSAADLAAAAPGLLRLDLPGCSPVSAATIEALAPLASSLASLDLSACWGLTDEGLRALMPLSALTRLNVSRGGGGEVTDLGVAAVAQLPSLRRLEMADCSLVTDAGLEALAAAPGAFSRLEHLDLRRCLGVTDDALAALASMAALRHLDLTGCTEITGRGLATYAGIGVGGVESDSEDDDDGVTEEDHVEDTTGGASSAWPRPRRRRPSHLETLRLGGCCGLCDDSVKASLRRMASLSHLDLTGCGGLTGRCLDGLGRSCPGLTRLDVQCGGGGGDRLSHEEDRQQQIADGRGWAEIGSLSRLTRLGAAALPPGLQDASVAALETLLDLRHLDLGRDLLLLGEDGEEEDDPPQEGDEEHYHVDNNGMNQPRGPSGQQHGEADGAPIEPPPPCLAALAALKALTHLDLTNVDTHKWPPDLGPLRLLTSLERLRLAALPRTRRHHSETVRPRGASAVGSPDEVGGVTCFFPSLKSLSIERPSLEELLGSPPGHHPFLSGLVGLTHLEALGWYSSSGGGGGSSSCGGGGGGGGDGHCGDPVLTWLGTLTALQHLRLWGAQGIPAKGLSELRGLSSLTHLALEGFEEHEDLGLEGLSGSSITALEVPGCCSPGTVEALKHLSGSLTSLDLSWSGAVTDSTLKEGVGGLSRLVQLNLNGCWSMTDEGLLEALRPLSKMQTLRTEGCHRISPIPALMLGLQGGNAMF